MFYIVNVHHIFYCVQNELLGLTQIRGYVEKELSNLAKKKQVCAFLPSCFVSCIKP